MSEAKEMVCVKCGCIESAEEKLVYIASEDAYYCEDCAKESGYVKCEKCGTWHRNDDDLSVVITSGGEEVVWCRSCVGGGTWLCERCDTLYDSRYYEPYVVRSHGYEQEWCECCRDDYAVTCGDCGELVDCNETYWVAGINDSVCEDCLYSGDYVMCDECNEYFREDDTHTDCGRTVCGHCAEYSPWWYYCYECGSYVYEDNWDSEMECCLNCVGARARSDNARVRSHSGDEPPIKYFGRYGDIFKGLGIELEIDRHDSNAGERQSCLNALDELFEDHAYYKYDGSLNYGIEIVTQPHTVEEFYKLPWEQALQACIRNGFSSHEVGTCGLHVHLSRTLFGDDADMQSDNIAKLMQFYNLYYEDILKVSRRTVDRAQQWANKYPIPRKDTLKKWAKDGYGNRYMAVNVTNEHTVEIRINRGTLKLLSFLATIDFVVTTAINSTKISWADISDDYQWLKGLKKETFDYIESRCAFYEPVSHYQREFRLIEQEKREAERRRQREEMGITEPAARIHTPSGSITDCATGTDPFSDEIDRCSTCSHDQWVYPWAAWSRVSAPISGSLRFNGNDD